MGRKGRRPVDPRKGRAKRTISSPKIGGENVEPSMSLMTGDCVVEMAKLLGENNEGAGWVDVTITDPPYEASGAAKQRRSGSDWSKSDNVTKKDIGFAPMTQALRMKAAYLIAKLTRRWVLTFCESEAVADWRAAYELAGLEYIRTGVWYKPDAMPQYSGDRPAQGSESILIMHPPGRKKWNGGGSHAHWTYPKNEGKGLYKRHPTQKPLRLMRKLVQLFSNPGELVLDPFMGAGSTGMAAVELGRKFYGIEIDNDWMRGASDRIAAHQNGLQFTSGRAERQGSL